MRVFTRQRVRKAKTPSQVSGWATSYRHVINIFRPCAMLVCLQLDEGQPAVLLMYGKYTVKYRLKLIYRVTKTRDINNEKTTHGCIRYRNNELRKTGALKKT
jgi:hypothetical protein